MDYTDLLCTSAGGVATITINRPDRYNAFRLKTVEAFLEKRKPDFQPFPW